MMKITSLFLGAVLATGLFASQSDAMVVYATEIDPTGITNTSTANDRDNPLNSLGAPDGMFTTLGLGGFADFKFGTSFTGPVELTETTFGNPADFLEHVTVFVGTGGVFTEIIEVKNTDANPIIINFMGTFDTVRLVDSTPLSSPSTDGWDVDAVGVTPIPLPATGLMLLGSVGALSLYRRRKAAS